jgi:hypothetical protein
MRMRMRRNGEQIAATIEAALADDLATLQTDGVSTPAVLPPGARRHPHLLDRRDHGLG